MKKIQYLLVTLVITLGFSACQDDFLTRYPEGGTLLEEQYAQLPDNLTGSIMGIYSKLYEYGGDHDEFGFRAIDMYGDFQSGDMAMKNETYGWFSSYDRGFFYVYARSYIWNFYYEIINLINISAYAVEDNLQDMIDGITGTPSAATIEQAYYYGQIMALRGWAYANLLNFYCNPMDEIDDLETEPSIPIYTEVEYAAGSNGEPRAAVSQVYERVYEDLSLAIELLDYYGKLHARDSKLEVDADVARIMLAYAMLNRGKDDIIADGKTAYDIAFEQAKAVIDGGKYPLMPQAELTTTGLSDVNAKNWLWGQDVTVETTTALASFFGQVDVHTYSYAAAGDTKCIDSKLYDELAAKGWDARVNWFNPGGVPNAYCPENKFYCPSTKNETSLDKVDRNWLCDNVFMRVEVAYLIAAEAAWAKGENSTAVNYLKQLCDERIIPGKETEATAWIESLSSADAIKAALIYNWRVEMWGEGYGLQTLRRLSKTNELGENHLDTRKGKPVNADETCQCEIPTSESLYNPNLNKYTYAHE